MVPELISNEIYTYLKKNTRTVINLDVEEGEERNKDAHQPSSGIKYKQAKKKLRLPWVHLLFLH
jgi:hypothetical protein